MTIFKVWGALKQGKRLANAATWKNRQIAASTIAAVLGGLIVVLPWFGLKLEVTNEDIMAIAGGVAALGGIINSLLTVATSKKVGLSAKPEGDAEEDSPGDWVDFAGN